MATRICPDCGAQYVATVRRCIDCDVVLVDEVAADADGDAAASSGAPVGDGDQLGYELEGWGNQLKVTLDGMLDRAGVARAWEAGALVVSARDEDVVDDLIATLEGGDVAELDDDAPRVGLEIEGLDADDHADLDARLLANAVPHAWADDGALIVAEADEERVLEIIDEALDRGDDGDDGLAAQDALSALYVAVDKLAKAPHDRKPATAYVRAAATLGGLGVPYGFGPEDWASLTEDAAALAALVAPHAELLPGEVPEPLEDQDDADGSLVDDPETEAAIEDDDQDDPPSEDVESADDEQPGDPEPAAGDEPDVDATPMGDAAVATSAALALRTRLVDLV